MKKVKSSRSLSFTLLLLLYFFTIVLGAAVFHALPFYFEMNLLLADVIATLFIFCWSLILGNASVYDPYWSVQPMVILIFCVLRYPVSVTGILFLSVVLIWGVRLTANWAYTFHGLDYQDWRYTLLHEQTGKFYPLINLVGIHMVPTFIVFFCVIPVTEVIKKAPSWNLPSLLFLCVSLCAVLIQGISDIQMHRFHRQRKKGFIREGFWKNSRHPNYLGEILMWWGIALASVTVLPGQYIVLTGAICNHLLFLFVSIPLADRHQSRKQGFDTYKAETRMLFPIRKWSVKKTATELNSDEQKVSGK